MLLTSLLKSLSDIFKFKDFIWFAVLEIILFLFVIFSGIKTVAIASVFYLLYLCNYSGLLCIVFTIIALLENTFKRFVMNYLLQVCGLISFHFGYVPRSFLFVCLLPKPPIISSSILASWQRFFISLLNKFSRDLGVKLNSVSSLDLFVRTLFIFGYWCFNWCYVFNCWANKNIITHNF